MLSHLRSVILCAASALLLASACSNTSSDPDTVLQSAGIAIAPLQLSNSQVASLHQSRVSDFQNRLVNDGVLTFEEYESSVFSHVRCLLDSGFEVAGSPLPGRSPSREPSLTRRGEYQYVYRNASKSEKDSLAAQMLCEEEFTSFVRLAWAEHVAPAPSEIQSARDKIAACLRESHIEISETPSRESLLAIGWPPDGHVSGLPEPLYAACAREVQLEFELPGFWG